MKIVQKLTPQDFGREFDPALFEEWKQGYIATISKLKMSMALWFVGLALLIIIGNAFGLILFFGCTIPAAVISVKQNSVFKAMNAKLGISKKQIAEAVETAKKRKE